MFRDRLTIQVFKPLVQQERIDLLIRLGWGCKANTPKHITRLLQEF
jgi:hypothetical protein